MIVVPSHSKRTSREGVEAEMYSRTGEVSLFLKLVSVYVPLLNVRTFSDAAVPSVQLHWLAPAFA